jgi:hypothetical protein
MLFLGCFTATQVFVQTLNGFNNITVLEQIKGSFEDFPNVYRKDRMTNWEEICGSRKYWPLWFFPIPIPVVQDGFGYPSYEYADETESLL